MSWIALTEADVQTRMTDTELAKYKAIGLASGQTTLVADVLVEVQEMVRGYVAGCERNTLAEGTKIPIKLKSSALDLAVMEIMKRCGGVITDVDDQRAESYNRAITLLERVSECRFAVADPVTPEDEVQADARGYYGYKKHVPINSLTVETSSNV
jgi:hypothetical protein